MLLQMALFHSFFFGGVIVRCVYVQRLLYPYKVDGYLGSFHVLPIANSAAIYIKVYVSFQLIVFPGYMHGGELLDHVVDLGLPRWHW